MEGKMFAQQRAQQRTQQRNEQQPEETTIETEWLPVSPKLHAPWVSTVGNWGEAAPTVAVYKMTDNAGGPMRRVLHLTFADGRELLLIDYVDLVVRP
jgi:hypothetical protein